MGWQLGHRPGLDGLRGVAILLVVTHHAVATHIPALSYSGPVGVRVFFVLSGFLIASILLTQMRDSGRLDVRTFYLRRAARLVPALLLAAAGAFVLAHLAGISPERIAPDVAFAVTYTSDFALAAGRDDMWFTHAWSLAVEEQFYLVLPPLLVFTRRWSPVRVTGVLLVAAVGWRVLAMSVYESPDMRYSPDMHAYALLTGCFLAALAVDGRLPAPPRWVAYSALVALFGLLLLPAVETNPLVLFGSVAAAAVIIAASGRPLPLLEVAPLRWLGTVSYGWYLWHGLMVGLVSTLTGSLIMAGLSLLIAVASWRYLERPILNAVRGSSKESNRALQAAS